MSTIDYNSAVKDMYATFSAVHKLQCPAVPVQYQGVPSKPLPADAAFMRVYVTSVDQDQRTIGMRLDGKRMFEAVGFITIEMYLPITPVGDEMQRILAGHIKNAFRAHSVSGKVTFSRPRIRSLPEDGIFYRRNVVADYEYDEVI